MFDTPIDRLAAAVEPQTRRTALGLLGGGLAALLGLADADARKRKRRGQGKGTGTGNSSGSGDGKGDGKDRGKHRNRSTGGRAARRSAPDGE